MKYLDKITLYVDSNNNANIEMLENTYEHLVETDNKISSILFKELNKDNKSILAEVTTLDNLKFKINLSLKNYFALLNVSTVRKNKLFDGRVYELIYFENNYHLLPIDFNFKVYKKMIERNDD